MSSSEDDSKGGNSVSELADFFNKQFSGGDERRKTTTTTDYNISEEEVIRTIFEKDVGRIEGFTFYYGRNSRGITGLFVRDVLQHGALAGMLQPGDQLIELNDEDIKNSEASSVNSILENLSGTVTIDVIRFRNPDEDTGQVASGSSSNSTPSPDLSFDLAAILPHSSDEPYEMERYENKIRENRSPDFQAFPIYQYQRIDSDSDIDTSSFNGSSDSSQGWDELQEESSTEEQSIENAVDSIEDFDELLTLLKVFNMKPSKEETFKMMQRKVKEKIKEQSSGKIAEFSAISKEREEDIQKREMLKHCYSVVENCLGEMDENLTSMLNTLYINPDVQEINPDVREILNERKERLERKDYNLLVAGETSAGKSSLINLFLGEEALPYHTLSTTSTICEVKYGEERKLVLHEKYDKGQTVKPPSKSIRLKTKMECEKSYEEQIKSYVSSDRTQTQTESTFPYEKVELHWPHLLLQAGVSIIDSPGFGESDEMDEVLMDYLPNAFGFIYVIDVSNAGGMNQPVKEKFRRMLGKIQSLDGRTQSGNRLTECSLFVCNKWDQIDENERDAVKQHVVAQLCECWESANLIKQIVYISTKNAKTARKYGGVTAEYNELIQKLKHAILRAIKKRLYDHWLWLDEILYRISTLAYDYRTIIKLNDKEIRERIKDIESHTAEIEMNHEKVHDEMEAELEKETKELGWKMYDYITMDHVKSKFCEWKDDSFPPKEKTWELTKSNIKRGVEYKFEELLIQWESENQIYSKIHKQLIEKFLTRLNVIEEELENTMHGEQLHDGLKRRRSPEMSKQTKVVIGVTSPIWLPVGLAGLVIGMPVLGAIFLKKAICEKANLEKYSQDPRTVLKKHLENFYGALTKTETFVMEYAEKQMEKTKNILSKYASYIPILVEANRKQVSHLRGETRTQGEIEQLYKPIERKCLAEQEKMTPLRIELYPATVDACDLEWKGDMNSCIGKGEFSSVYKGKLKNDERVETVAVKLFEQPIDLVNQRFYLCEEQAIRYLDHKNVAKFFGAMNINISYQSEEQKIAFVTELFDGNLRSIIFENESSYNIPAKAYDTNAAIKLYLYWAMEIAEGLSYIHKRRLVHGHLKASNIMVNKEDVRKVKIADIGIVGPILKTKESIMYLAPEVQADVTVRKKEADIYSYGIMLWEMWYGIQAFTELMPLDETIFQEIIADGYRPQIDRRKIAHPEVHEIMEQCWSSDIDKRPTAKNCEKRFEDIYSNF